MLRALAIDPELPGALCSYALVVARAGQPDKARALIDRAEQLEPGSDEVLATRYHVALMYDDDAVRMRLAEELARRSVDADSLAVLGLESAYQGRFGAGLNYLERALRANAGVVGADVLGTLRTLRHPLTWAAWPVFRFGAEWLLVVLIGGGSC